MELNGLIYLDNAATTFPKPYSVIEKTAEYMLNRGGNPGRGGHPLSLGAAEAVYDCRRKLSDMFGADSPERVVFTMNTTYGLNMAIKGLLKRGDHVLISDMEHNAVYRPIRKLAEQGIITYDVFPTMVQDPLRSDGRICAGIAQRMKKNTRMLICAGASNICSAAMPIAAVGALCRSHGVLFVVDGAQCAGHMPLSVKDMNIDVLCIPGHKGLYGPQGCGAVIFGKRTDPDTIIEGGNGVASLEWRMWGDMPEKYEAGTLPVPAVIGLSSGIDEISAIGIGEIDGHEKKLFSLAAERLGNTRGVTVYLPRHQGSVLLFNVDGMPSDRVSEMLSDSGICIRSGYHCNALGHGTLRTPEGGAVRASFGIFNSSEDAVRLCSAVESIVKNK